jgi:multicomponent Na+:H+ antiporter subunit C
MTLLVSAVVATIFGSGCYLLLKGDLFRVVAGTVLISNAAVLTLVAAGFTRGAAPIRPFPDGSQVSDPLVQALALTALIIGFGVTALLLTIAFRVYAASRTVDLEQLSRMEASREDELEEAED